MKQKVVIIGAGGHAKVVIDILKSGSEYDVIGCIAKKIEHQSVLGVPILGEDLILAKLFASDVTNAFVAIGDNKLREKLSLEVENIGFNLINAIAPKAYVSKSATLGKGIAIMPGAVINAEASIGSNVIVNTSATVDHDCIVEDYVHIAPGVHLAGNVNLGKGTFLGVGSSIIPQTNIGEWCVIGAGTVVIKDLPPFSKCAGVPAKLIGEISNFNS